MASAIFTPGSAGAVACKMARLRMDARREAQKVTFATLVGVVAGLLVFAMLAAMHHPLYHAPELGKFGAWASTAAAAIVAVLAVKEGFLYYWGVKPRY